ncbi:MAG: MBL fold metallo-hydrolase [Pseudomonadota bacterium]
MINIKKFCVGPIYVNTYIVNDFKTKKAIIIDPGGENELILQYLNENNLQTEFIIATHGHIDHVAGAKELCNELNLPFYLNSLELNNLELSKLVAPKYGYLDFEIPEVYFDLNENTQLSIGNVAIKIISTPGHTAGGISLLIDEKLFSGDTIFFESIGRCDLPGGHEGTLLKTIQDKIFSLPGEIIIFPGHGQQTSVAYEKESNPYIYSNG